jgi:hypothetical protein
MALASMEWAGCMRATRDARMRGLNKVRVAAGGWRRLRRGGGCCTRALRAGSWDRGD